MNKISAAITLFLVLSVTSVAFAANHEKPPIQDLEAEFQSLIEVETVADGWKVAEYDSSSALEEAFYKIMSPELAQFYLNQYFNEKEDGYYKLPQDAPPYIDFEKEYELEEVTQGRYQLIQDNQNELRGEYTLTVQYENHDGKWMMVDRNNIVGKSSGGELPTTATSYPLWMLIGILLAVTGGVLLIRKRRFIF